MQLRRLLVGAILPCPIACLPLMVVMGFHGLFKLNLEALGWIPIILFYAYLLMGIQSLLFALIMEYPLRKWHDAGTINTVAYHALAAMLGILCGLSLQLLGPMSPPAMVLYGVLGIAAGSITAAVLLNIPTPKP